MYSDRAAGDGRSCGGYAKPSLVVSKMPMSLAESPMVEPSLHRPPPPKPTVPQRGGPRQRAVVDDVASDDDNDGDSTRSDILSAPDVYAGGQPGDQHVLDMANPDRPYHMYPSGK